MHKAFLASLLVLGVLLSGCADSSDGGGGGGAGTQTSSSTMTSTGPPPKPIVYSDTLHLLAAPEMAPALPEGSAEVETGTAGNFGPGGGGGDGPASQWAYKVSGNSNLTAAEIHVWIDIKETLLQSPFSNPSQPPCTWYILLALGGDADPERVCKAEPAGPINPGIKELVFDLVGIDSELEANETIEFQFGRTVFSTSQTDAVTVLSGSADHDSRLLLKGLKEALPSK